MKKSLIFGLGMVLMALQANVWAATCATEKKAKGYMVKVLSPAMATVINKNDPFLVQYSDPGQSLGIVVTVALHTITGNKKAPKAVKALKNQPNSGSVLLTGANLMNPGSKADGKFFFRVSGAGKSVDSYCFTFAPQLKGAAKQTADAELQGLQQTVKTYAEQIAALTKELAEVKQQLAATGTEGAGSLVKAGSKIKLPGTTKDGLTCGDIQGKKPKCSHTHPFLEELRRKIPAHVWVALGSDSINTLSSAVSRIQQTHLSDQQDTSRRLRRNLENHYELVNSNRNHWHSVEVRDHRHNTRHRHNVLQAVGRKHTTDETPASSGRSGAHVTATGVSQ